MQALQFALADMAVDIQAGRLLTYRAAYLLDQDAPATQAAAFAKKFAADATMAITTRVVQLFGAYGYLRGNPVERYMRLAKMTQLIDGTSEIQQVVIARNLLR
jgi:alkylation response protein AidB-like acyl-CoA dehydrogenase